MKYINWSTSVFPGFYESELYNSDTLYNFTANDDGCEFDFIDGGFEKYCNAVCAQVPDALLASMAGADAITDIKFVALHSPRFYNFETDKIECDVVCDWQKIVNFAQVTERRLFDQYLHENFTSYDGFISFVPNTTNEFWDKLDTDFDRLADVLIEFYILNHLDQDWWRESLYEIATNTIWQYLEPVKDDDTNNN